MLLISLYLLPDIVGFGEEIQIKRIYPDMR